MGVANLQLNRCKNGVGTFVQGCFEAGADGSAATPQISVAGASTGNAGAAGRVTYCGSGAAGAPYKEHTTAMFVFFSNRLGCLGSVAVSLVLTVLLLLFFGVI